MTFRRAEPITHLLLNGTVLQEWFRPMEKCLHKVRYSDKVFQSLPMLSFIMTGGLRQLLSIQTLREQVQMLFNFDETARRIPVPRSTWSDALKSDIRCSIVRQATEHLVDHARSTLPDRLVGVDGIDGRDVFAIDATYQIESSHFYRVLPVEGGDDNQKGSMLMTYYDIRAGIPVNVKIETRSMGEMRVLKNDYSHAKDWSRVKRALYVVDRAFIDGVYWDERKTKLKATVITRMKSTLSFSVVEERQLSTHISNEKVLSDQKIQLKSSNQPWRLIKWLSPSGIEYEYLTNDLELEPGVVAFLYYRRWDEEKYFDNFKNDMANKKAWGKSPVAIEQQALMGMMTYMLTRLFLHDRYNELDLIDGDTTQKRKQHKKIEQYFEVMFLQKNNNETTIEDDDYELLPQYDAYRAYYAQISKITRQVWRFFKSCFNRISSPQLYEVKLRPILIDYL